MWHDSLLCVTWLIVMCDMTPSYTWHDSFICVTWLIVMSDMTPSYMWHDSFICVTWLLHTCDKTRDHMTRDDSRWSAVSPRVMSVRCHSSAMSQKDDGTACEVPCHSDTALQTPFRRLFVVGVGVRESVYMRDLTHLYMWYDSFICVTWLIHMWDMTHSYVWHASISLTWCVCAISSAYSLAEYSLFYRALLQKRPIILRSLLIALYMCTWVHIYVPTCTYTYTYIYIPTCTCTYTYLYTHMHIYIYIYIYPHAHIHIHIYVRTYIHMYIYGCIYM